MASWTMLTDSKYSISLLLTKSVFSCAGFTTDLKKKKKEAQTT